MIEILLAVLIGIIIGTVTGLLPGIHINLVAAGLIPFLLEKSSLEPFILAAGIVALAATHTILDFIPSIYLGVPEEETAISVLPAHKLLQEGKGNVALILVLAGAGCGIIALIVTIPALIYAMPFLESKTQMVIPFVLIGIALFMICRERSIVGALVSFSAAGFLGYATLNLPVREPLFPLLGGLFGISGLWISLNEKTKLIPQRQEVKEDLTSLKADIKKTIRDVLFTGLPCATLPALGSGYAAFITSEVTRPSLKRFLMITSALNVYVMAASFILVQTLGKARTGAAAEVSLLVGTMTGSHLTIIITIFIITTCLASLIALRTSKIALRGIERVSYSKMSLWAIVFMTIVVIMVSGLAGLLILATGTAIGVYTIKSRLRRMHLMGCLIVPTLFYYLG